MISEENPVVKFIGGQILKALMAAEVPGKNLWTEVKENVYTEFPDPHQSGSQFLKSFQLYVEEYIDQDNDQFLGFSLGTVTNPKTSIMATLPSLLYVGPNLVIFTPARGAMFDQCLEIVLKNVTVVGLYDPEEYRDTIPGATDLFIHLENVTSPGCYLNGQAQDILHVELNFHSFEEAEDLLKELCALNSKIRVNNGDTPLKVSQSTDIFDANATGYSHPPIPKSQKQPESLWITGPVDNTREDSIVPESNLRGLDDIADEVPSDGSGSPEDNTVKGLQKIINKRDDNKPHSSEAAAPLVLVKKKSEEEYSWRDPAKVTDDVPSEIVSARDSQGLPNRLKALREAPEVYHESPSNRVHSNIFGSPDELVSAPDNRNSPSHQESLAQKKEALTSNTRASIKPSSVTQPSTKKTTFIRNNAEQFKSISQKKRKSLRIVSSSDSLTSPEPQDASTPKPNTSELVVKPQKDKNVQEKVGSLKRPAEATSTSRQKKPKMYSLAPKRVLGSSPINNKNTGKTNCLFEFPSSDSEPLTKPIASKGRKAPAKGKPVISKKIGASQKTGAPKKRKIPSNSEPQRPQRSKRKAAESANSKIHSINSDEAAIDETGQIIPSARNSQAEIPSMTETTKSMIKKHSKKQPTSQASARAISTIQSKEDVKSVSTVDIPSFQMTSHNQGKQTEDEEEMNLDVSKEGIPEKKRSPTNAGTIQIDDLQKLEVEDARELGLFEPVVGNEDILGDQCDGESAEPIVNSVPMRKNVKDMAAAMSSMLEALPDPSASPETYLKNSITPVAAQNPNKINTSGQKESNSLPSDQITKSKPAPLLTENISEEKNIDTIAALVKPKILENIQTAESAIKKRKTDNEAQPSSKKQCIDTSEEHAHAESLQSKKAELISQKDRVTPIPNSLRRQSQLKSKPKSPQSPTRRSPRLIARNQELQEEVAEKSKLIGAERGQMRVEEEAGTSRMAIAEEKFVSNEFMSRKPAVIGFGSNGPRNQGRRQLKRASPLKMPLMIAKDASVSGALEVELPAIASLSKLSEHATDSKKENKQQNDGRIPKTLIVPFSQEDLVVIISDGDTSDSYGDLDSVASFTTSKNQTTEDKLKPPVSRADEKGSPKALTAPANNNYKRVARKLLPVPSMTPKHPGVAEPTTLVKTLEKEQPILQRAVKDVSLLSNEPRSGAASPIDPPEKSIRVLHHQESEKCNELMSKPDMVSDKSDDPFVGESVTRRPTVLTEKFRDLSKSVSNPRIPLVSRQNILGRRNRVSDDKTLVEPPVLSSPSDITDDSSDSEEKLSLDDPNMKDVDDWRNALQPHYRGISDALSRINKASIGLGKPQILHILT